MDTTWTDPSQIKRVRITYYNGDYAEFNIDTIVCDPRNCPLWITHTDENGFEVLTPWSAIISMIVLERRGDLDAT